MRKRKTKREKIRKIINTQIVVNNINISFIQNVQLDINHVMHCNHNIILHHF